MQYKLSLIMSFLCVSQVCATESAIEELKRPQVTLYGYVGQQLIAASGGVEQVEVPDDGKNPHFDMIPLTEKQKLSMAFELFAKREKESADYDGARNLIKDLDLFTQVFPAIDCTKTACGKAVLAHELVQPCYEKARGRQELIAQLVAREDLYKHVEKILSTAHDAEAGLFSFQVKESSVTEKYIEKLYFEGMFKNYNTDTLSLEVLTRLDNLKSVLQVSSIPLSLIAGKFIGHYIGLKITGHDMPAHEAWHETTKMLNSMYNPYAYRDALVELNSEKKLQELRLTYLMWRDDPGFINRYPTEESYINFIKKITRLGLGASGLSAAYLIFLEGLQIKDVAAHVRQVRDTACYLQTRLIGVASFVESLRGIRELAKNEPSVKMGLSKIDAVIALIDHARDMSRELDSLVQLLQTNTFKGNASYFSLIGRVLAAHKLMNECKDALIPAMEALGELDACFSMAQLYKKYADARVNYSFVEFVDADKPAVMLEDFWNPVVDARVVVPNSLELGGSLKEHAVILTGANTGGKSTILKAMLLDVLLAHTFGLAPAKKARMTPYRYIGSSLHILDDTAAGISLFKAEVLRAQALLKAFEALSTRCFGFVVIDELFTGTAIEVGQEQAYQFAQHLCGFNNALFVLATHFKRLTDLENGTAGICKNYKIDVVVAPDGSIMRPFKLEPGVCSVNIAQALVHDAMGDVTGNTSVIA